MKSAICRTPPGRKSPFRDGLYSMESAS